MFLFIFSILSVWFLFDHIANILIIINFFMHWAAHSRCTLINAEIWVRISSLIASSPFSISFPYQVTSWIVISQNCFGFTNPLFFQQEIILSSNCNLDFGFKTNTHPSYLSQFLVKALLYLLFRAIFHIHNLVQRYNSVHNPGENLLYLHKF